MTLQLAWQLNGLSWSVAQNVTSIFEAVGAVQDGMRSIAAPQQMPTRKRPRAAGLERRNRLRECLVWLMAAGAPCCAIWI